MAGEKILIIDDATALNFVLCFDFKRKGYKAISARNGEKGIEEAKTEKPDLILLDIVLGKGIDGFEVLDTLKKGDETKDIPVIMTTALSEREDIRRALNLGASAYVIKPFGFNELLEKIVEVIGS